jgi:flagellar FliL protein
MADTETPPAEGEKKKKGLPPAAIPALAIVLGIGGGGFVGASVVAPKLTHGIGTGVVSAAELSVDRKKKGADHAEDGEEPAEGEDGEEHADEEGEEGGDEKKKDDHAPAGPPAVYTVADMVLNPAGSGGQRFVMLSVAMEAKDSATVAMLESRDPEIRDAILALVGGKTVEQLAEVTAREPLKTEIIATVARITKKKKAVKRVSFPQFVIQ